MGSVETSTAMRGINMTQKFDYRFENFMEYHGEVEHVKKLMDQCSECGAKLLLSHMSDYRNMIIQETARCLDCGQGTKRIIHIIN